MNGSYEVVTAALEGHARTLSGLAGELRGAAELAGQVTMTGDAYGQTGQRFAALLQGPARTGQDTLRAAVEALESAVTNLRDTVAAYEGQDATGAAGFTGIRSTLP